MNKTKRGVFIITMLTIMSMLSGCFNDLGEGKIKKMVVERLEGFYGGTYSVVDVKKRAANTAFGDGSYILTVHADELDKDITVRVRTDGEMFGDTYEQMKYSDQVENEIKSVSKIEEGWSLSDLNVHYSYGIGDTRTSSFEEYKGDSEHVYIRIKADVYGTDATQAASSIYDFVTQLRDRGYKWKLDLEMDDKEATVEELKDDEQVTAKDIEDALVSIGGGNE